MWLQYIKKGFSLISFLSGYIIQFCIVSCFFWLTVMWIDICIHAWYYLPRGIKQTPKDDNLHLMYYSIFAFGLPLILVILTYKNKLSGLPSYYLKGTTEGAFHVYKTDKSIDYIWYLPYCRYTANNHTERLCIFIYRACMLLII